MSILGKSWQLKNTDSNKTAVQKVMENRGLTDATFTQSFLKDSYKKGLHNPFLMKDMDKAVERVKKAIKDGERIMVFGDYDVDGISGTAILVHTFKILGAKISYRLPHRVEDGYGLSEKFIREFADLKVGLVITVDCGVSCASQISLAKDLGVDVIVTDHHTVPEIFPDKAYAVLHTLQPGCNYPFKGLTGAGVAYKFACALLHDTFKGEERENYLYSLLDLASLGTVADLGPLVDENRIIVKYGLEALQKTRWPGLSYLKEMAGIDSSSKLDISVIGFRLGPRINAAGRIDSPYYALQLLLYDEPNEKGKVIAEHLEKLNQRRQIMVAEAIEQALDSRSKAELSDRAFVAWSPDWHVGILGLIASKIVEKYQQPAIIMQDFGEYLVGSARSPESFNLVDALTAHGNILENFGGHAQAAGFNLRKENLPEFAHAMKTYANEKLKDQEIKQELTVDCELNEEDINENLLTLLEQMEPFGIGNEQPRFLIRGLEAVDVKRVGKEQQHLHFRLQGKRKRIPVIAFKLGHHETMLRSPGSINLVCSLVRNEWKGMTQVQLRAIDFAK